MHLTNTNNDNRGKICPCALHILEFIPDTAQLENKMK